MGADDFRTWRVFAESDFSALDLSERGKLLTLIKRASIRRQTLKDARKLTPWESANPTLCENSRKRKLINELHDLRQHESNERRVGEVGLVSEGPLM